MAMEISNEELPEGWTIKKLREICDIGPRKSELSGLQDSMEVSFVPMPCVLENLGGIVDSKKKKLSDVKKGYTYFKDGDILFAKITPCMENGKVALAKDLVYARDNPYPL